MLSSPALVLFFSDVELLGSSKLDQVVGSWKA